MTKDGALITAILAGIAGILTAWAAVVRAKRKGNEECERKLRECREEQEKLWTRLQREWRD